jgi:branched-chain amino acid transport system permease protein
MSLFAQQLVLGLLLGGVYVAVAIGFSLVWGVLNIVNLAHGALVMLGAYLTWWLFTNAGMDPFVSLPIDAVALFAVGYLVQRTLINRVIRAPLFFTLLLTFGINLIAVNLILLLFTSDFRAVAPSYAGSGMTVGAVEVPYIRLAAFAVALLVAGAIGFLMNRTRIGLAIRAVGADRDAAQLVGIDLRHVYALTFGVGAAAAGVAGGLIGTIYSITPTAGEPYTLQAFVVVILGGLGRVSATVVGGILFGLIEVLAQTQIPQGAGWANAIAFAVLVLVLVLRPQGIMGRRPA